VVLYYAGAGLISAWAVAGWKHFMKSRGIELPDVSMPPPPNDGDGEEETPPETERNTGISDDK